MTVKGSIFDAIYLHNSKFKSSLTFPFLNFMAKLALDSHFHAYNMFSKNLLGLKVGTVAYFVLGARSVEQK